MAREGIYDFTLWATAVALYVSLRTHLLRAKCLQQVMKLLRSLQDPDFSIYKFFCRILSLSFIIRGTVHSAGTVRRMFMPLWVHLWGPTTHRAKYGFLTPQGKERFRGLNHPAKNCDSRLKIPHGGSAD